MVELGVSSQRALTKGCVVSMKNPPALGKKRPGPGTPAARKVLSKAGMTLDDIDLFEVNEAFAAVVLRFQQAFDVDPALVNVNGGAIAMGHPLGATGAMIIGTLLDELERSDKEIGLATLCIASGMGAATMIERV